MHSIWLVLVLSVLSSSASADTIGDLTYEIADDQVVITDCSRTAGGELVIPSEIEGLRVGSIGESAFYNRGRLTTITIPGSVTNIGDSAFYNCLRLTSIAIGSSVISIGNYAFRNCSSLTTITMPEGVTTIGYHAFHNCNSLTSITIPDSVNSIGDWAFYDCTSLSYIELPESYHSRSEANRLGIQSLFPDGIFRSAYRRAKAIALLTNGFVVGVDITDGGGNYREVPVVTIAGGDGTGAEAVAVLTEGRVTSIEMINAGRGYTSQPTITIEPPIVPTTQVSLRMVPAITIIGDVRQPKIIEVADTADGPWTVWRTVVLGWNGTTEVDLDEGAEKRFYRVRD